MLQRLRSEPAKSADGAPLDATSSLDSFVTRAGESVAQMNTRTRKGVSVLAVGTEWESRHGGLSTFNRDLCTELAAAGHTVVCVVPEATPEEITHAHSLGVQLLSPLVEAGLDGLERLLLNIVLPAEFEPAFIIGHDRKTGPYAKIFKERFSAAKLALFIHTRPDDIEWHKDKLGPDDATHTAEQRKDLQKKLASDADIVIGVGPNLATHARMLVHLFDPKPISHQFVPGIRALSTKVLVPPEANCLLLGRAEDLKLKGLDIAAKAIGKLSDRKRNGQPPRLIVRGAPKGEGDALKITLTEIAGHKIIVEPREYTANVATLKNDILMSSLVLMPSRSEGFGLVALEAIAAGVPLLVSNHSGIATLLRDRLGTDADPFIVDTVGDLDRAAEEWSRNIERVLMNRSATFAEALSLRTRLSDELKWEDAILALESAWSPLLQSESPAN